MMKAALLLLLLLFVLSSQGKKKPTLSDASFDQFSPASFRLILAVQKLRKDLGLGHLPLSPSLMHLAATHVKDLKQNFGALQSQNCTSPLSWYPSKSSEGTWSGCCLSKENATHLTDCGIEKAAELLHGYEGLAKELIVKIDEETRVENILDAFIKDKYSYFAIANKDLYRFVEWKAIGAAVDGGFASLWFGNSADKVQWKNGTDSFAPAVPTPEGRKLPCDFNDGLDEGAAVIDMLSVFRAQQNFSSIPISPSLMYVARAHAKNLYEHFYTRTASDKQCTELSWFNSSGVLCCVQKGMNGEDSPCVFDRPKKLIDYAGDSYEIVYVDKNRDADLEPIEILNNFLKTPLYNAVLFNLRLSETDDYTFIKWLAAGAAVKGGVATLWLGDSDDFADCIEDTVKTTKPAEETDDGEDATTEAPRTLAPVIYHRYDFDEPAYDIVRLVNNFRTKNNVSALSLSASLFAVAELHIENLVGARDTLMESGCTSLLSWASNDLWDECCITQTTESYECSQTKPSEVAKEYKGKAVELVIKIVPKISPAAAFDLILSKKGYKEHLLSKRWTTIGGEFQDGYASVWLGMGKDGAKWYKKTSPSPSAPIKTR